MEYDNQDNLKQVKPAKKPTTLVVVLIAALLAAATMGYLWWRASNDIVAERKATSDAKSEIESLKNEQKTSDNTMAATNSDDSPSADSDNKNIIAAAGAYNHAHKGAADVQYEITIAKKEGQFARTLLNVKGEVVGGFYCLLKKSDNLWVVILCGQDYPTQDDIDMWGIPETIYKTT